ncbi:MAG: HPr family phosphocarrier protein [Limisphaerales bacterium]
MAGRTQPVVQTLRQTFVVEIEHGLHLRPCALLVKTLQPYRSSVQVEARGKTAFGDSVLGFISLAAEFGSEITFTIVGEDASRAMAAVRKLFAGRFKAPDRASALPRRPIYETQSR